MLGIYFLAKMITRESGIFFESLLILLIFRNGINSEEENYFLDYEQ